MSPGRARSSVPAGRFGHVVVTDGVIVVTPRRPTPLGSNPALLLLVVPAGPALATFVLWSAAGSDAPGVLLALSLMTCLFFLPLAFALVDQAAGEYRLWGANGVLHYRHTILGCPVRRFAARFDTVKGIRTGVRTPRGGGELLIDNPGLLRPWSLLPQWVCVEPGGVAALCRELRARYGSEGLQVFTDTESLGPGRAAGIYRVPLLLATVAALIVATAWIALLFRG